MKGNGLSDWLFPRQEALGSGWRIAVGLVANLGLAVYFLPNRERLWDIRDFRHVLVNLTMASFLVVIPTVVLLLLIPLIARGQTVQRWIGIGLTVFPAYLALAGWVHLIVVALSE